MARITILQNSNEAVDYKAGQVVFNQGDEADHMYVVVDGAIDITVSGVPVGTVEPGETFGEMALIDRSRRSGTRSGKDGLPCRADRPPAFPLHGHRDAQFRFAAHGHSRRAPARQGGRPGRIGRFDRSLLSPKPLSPKLLLRASRRAASETARNEREGPSRDPAGQDLLTYRAEVLTTGPCFRARRITSANDLWKVSTP